MINTGDCRCTCTSMRGSSTSQWQCLVRTGGSLVVLLSLMQLLLNFRPSTATVTKRPCKYLCPDGVTCVARITDLCYNGCQYNQVKCADGSCKHYARLCVCHAWRPYPCDGGIQCYSAKEICDGKRHCKDGMDEQSCPPKNRCSSDAPYPCQDGIRCYSNSERCDGRRDCLDGTDEHRCGSNKMDATNRLLWLITIPVVLIATAIYCWWRYCRANPNERDTECRGRRRGTLGFGDTLRQAHFTSADGVTTANNGPSGQHNEAFTAYPEQSLPPTYQDVVRDSQQISPQPHVQPDDELPSYESVAHVQPAMPLEVPSVTARVALPYSSVPVPSGNNGITLYDSVVPSSPDSQPSVDLHVPIPQVSTVVTDQDHCESHSSWRSPSTTASNEPAPDLSRDTTCTVSHVPGSETLAADITRTMQSGSEPYSPPGVTLATTMDDPSRGTLAECFV